MPQSSDRRRLALALTVALLASLGAGCRGSEPHAEDVVGSRPNVVLVVLCSFRPDRMGSMGYSRGLTPFLDRMAAEGVVFENAVSASSWTKPSTASLMTGLTPGVHGMRDFYRPEDIESGEAIERRVLPEGLAILPAALSRAGYDTFCRVNNVHAGEFFGLTRGCQDQVTRFGLSTDEMVGQLASWLDRRESSHPFFAYLFSREVHSPYQAPYEDFRALRAGGDVPAPDEFNAWRDGVRREVWRLTKARRAVPEPLRRAWIDLYDAQFPGLDRALARLPSLVAGHDAGRDTLFVVTGDHGDRLFEGGRIDHGGARLDQAVLHIPLLAWGAGAPAGRRVAPVVRSIDLFPTLLDLAGADPPPLVQGESLVPLIWPGSGELPAPRAAFSSAGTRSFAVRLGRYKLRLRHGHGQSLYDLETDPWEEHDLLAAEPRVARRLHRELERWLEQEAALSKAVDAADTRALPPEVIEELKALGYL